MLTSILTGSKGLVFKSKINEKGQTPYTIILGKNFILPWMYKTATLYKDWEKDSPNLELVINKIDSTRYRKGVKKKKFIKVNYEELQDLIEDMKNLPEEKKNYLIKSIENLPERIIMPFYEILDESLFPNQNKNDIYGFEIQKVNSLNDSNPDSNETRHKREELVSISRRLSNRLLEKFYNKLCKKALSFTQILPL